MPDLRNTRYLWGAALDKLGRPKFIAVKVANEYHKSAYEKEVKLNNAYRYRRVGPVNEANHVKAIKSGYNLF